MSDEMPRVPERYAISRRLGQGGMATVWLAEDRVTSTQVALKILLPHLRENEVVVERFKREVAAVRRVDHPNVITIYDLLETDSVLALVLEHVQGLDLKRRIRREGPLSSGTVISIGQQLLAALAAAHKEGIVHRDVKPHNVLVTDEGQCKLTDFGVARVDDLVRVTSHTMAFGSPEYVAPELLSSPFADARADIYSAGATLFEALTGRPPFRASSPLELLRMHEEAAPPDLAELAPQAPASLRSAIAIALSKDPELRFATAELMSTELSRETPNQAMQEYSGAMQAVGETCAYCSASLVRGLDECIECEQRQITIHAQLSGGKKVLIPRIVSPGGGSDGLTFQTKQRLIDTLKQMGGNVPASPNQLDRRLRELPVTVASGLSDDEAIDLVGALHKIGIPQTKTGWAGTAGDFQAMTMMHAPLKTWLGVWLFAAVLPFVALTASSAFPTGLVGLYFLVASSLTIRGFFSASRRRTKGIATFSGARGFHEGDHAIAARAKDVFGRIHGQRLRNLLRRLLNRGLALHERLTDPDARQQVAQLLGEALDKASNAARLEADLESLDPNEITDRIQTLAEQIEASQDTYETTELIDEKSRLHETLGELDDKQAALSKHYGQLLETASELVGISESLQTL